MNIQIPQSKTIAGKEYFNRYDKDQDGLITFNEAGEVMKSLGVKMSKNDLEQMQNELDNGKGKVNLEMVLYYFAKKSNYTATEEELVKSFQIFDRDGNGVITSDELRYLMTSLGEKLSETEADEMINNADMDGDGYINYKEFVRLMLAK